MEEGVLIAEAEVSDKPFDSSQRLRICQECPLFLHDTEVCNPYLWMNPETGETSEKAKAGYTKGCGCLISKKARQPGSHCHFGKW